MKSVRGFVQKRAEAAVIWKKRAQAKVCALFCGEQRLDSHVVEPLRELYRRKLRALVDLQIRIEQAIESLTSTEREMMRLRYIDGADRTEVATEVDPDPQDPCQGIE